MAQEKCESCGILIDADLNRCPHCRNLRFPGSVTSDSALIEKTTLDRIRRQIQDIEKKRAGIADEVYARVEARLTRRRFLWFALMVWTLVLTLACAVILFRIYAGSADYLKRAVEDELSHYQIESSIEKAAEDYVLKMTEERIDPALNLFTESVQKSEEEMTRLKDEFKNKYESLAREVHVMELRKKLMSFSERALSGSRKAYEQLIRYSRHEESPDIKMLASYYRKQVHSFFQTTNRIAGYDLNIADDSGKGYVNETIPLPKLLETLRDSPHWKSRAKAARLLENKIEPGVAEALLQAMKTDPFLDVVQQSLHSFKRITGYVSDDILSFENAENWWQQNGPAASETA